MPAPRPPGAAPDPARALLQDARRALAGGHPHQAAALARRLARLRPRDRDALNACAWIAHQAGERRDAARYLEQSLALDGAQVEALSNLASLRLAAGRAADALPLLERALVLAPDQAALHYNHGNALKATGQPRAAAAAFRAAIERDASVPAFHGNLANTLAELGEHEAAVAAYRASLALRPDHAETLRHLGQTLRLLRRWDEAQAALDAALAREPGNGEIVGAQAALLRDRGDVPAAIARWREAIARTPGLAALHLDLGEALLRESQLDDAVTCFEAALRLDPALVMAEINLAATVTQQGRLDAALTRLEALARRRPDDATVGQALLFALQYDAMLPPAALAERHRAWARRHADPLAPAVPAATDPDPDRRLRVGYVSPDFRWHAVSDFLMPLIANHDRGAVEVTCYADVARPDPRTAEFAGLADRWRLTVGLDDAALADRIRDDAIDLLVDLAGHTAGNRLGVFARRPAPVQVTWLGYPCTTGMAAIGWRLTDALADPAPAAEALHAERLLRLPGGFDCYRPRRPPPDVTPLPAGADGPVSFGSFNNLAKINDGVIDTWVRILDAVPGSRLTIKFHQLADMPTRDRLAARFAARGVAADRLTLAPGIRSWESHMAQYGAIDIGLDPFPYNGTTTTCEALWMGVPVIALAGDRHAGRVGLSLLTRIGLPELVATDPDDYVARAVALAGDRARLAALRAGLRDRCDATLGDGARFAREVEAGYREAWRAWCAERTGGGA